MERMGLEVGSEQGGSGEPRFELELADPTGIVQGLEKALPDRGLVPIIKTRF
jgi:hypothetical protein